MLFDSLINYPIGYGGVFILLVFLGYFRSIIQNQKPDFILDQKKIQNNWLKRSSFTSILLFSEFDAAIC